MVRLLAAVGLLALIAQVSSQNVRAAQSPDTMRMGVAIASKFEDMRLPTPLVVAQIHSLAVVAADLDQDGKVVSTSAISGSEPLLTLSRENLSKWTFVPNAEKRVVMAYYFKMEGTCVDNTRTLFQMILNNFVMVTGCVRRAMP